MVSWSVFDRTVEGLIVEDFAKFFAEYVALR